MLPTLPFGTTGHASTRIIFGAAALSDVSQDDANRTMETVIAAGINHIDTAASYGDAELRLAPTLRTERKRFFLATKTGERLEGPAYDQIRTSLVRMGVDQIDLIQLHNLVDPAEWTTAMGPGGALEGAVRARDEGLVRFIGVTGHGVTVAAQHKRALEQFPFDSVLLPYSYVLMQDSQYARDFEALATLCQERGVATQTIKAITQRPWGDRPATTATWYEPLRDQADIDLAVNWVLGRPDVFLNTVGDIALLPNVLDAAARFTARPSDAQMMELAAKREMAPLFV